MSTGPDPNPISLGLGWGQDLVLTPNGSLQFVTGVLKVQQRIVRRYFTGAEGIADDGSYQPPEYIMDPSYGFGASRLVGEKISPKLAAQLTVKIKNAVLVDESVDTTRDPTIKLFATQRGTVWAQVTCYLLDAQEVILNFKAQ